MSLASLSPTADADADSDEKVPRLERGAGAPGWCLSSDRQAWNNRTKLARDDLYIGLIACREEICGAVIYMCFVQPDTIYIPGTRFSFL